MAIKGKDQDVADSLWYLGQRYCDPSLISELLRRRSCYTNKSAGRKKLSCAHIDFATLSLWKYTLEKTKCFAQEDWLCEQGDESQKRSCVVNIRSPETKFPLV